MTEWSKLKLFIGSFNWAAFALRWQWPEIESGCSYFIYSSECRHELEWPHSLSSKLECFCESMGMPLILISIKHEKKLGWSWANQHNTHTCYSQKLPRTEVKNKGSAHKGAWLPKCFSSEGAPFPVHLGHCTLQNLCHLQDAVKCHSLKDPPCQAWSATEYTHDSLLKEVQ